MSRKKYPITIAGLTPYALAHTSRRNAIDLGISTSRSPRQLHPETAVVLVASIFAAEAVEVERLVVGLVLTRHDTRLRGQVNVM